MKITSITSLNLSDDWETSCQQIKDYCHVNNASYYSASKDTFSIHEAVEFAKSHGSIEVVVEDLS